MLLHYMRMWDQRTASGVDEFIANSHFIGRRINKSYRRQSTVIYPPVDTRQFTLHEAKEDFYLTASRMVPYKKIPLIVEAFAAMPDKRLIVIGTGPEMDKAREVAGPNVTLLGYQSSRYCCTTCSAPRALSSPPRKTSVSPRSRLRPAARR